MIRMKATEILNRLIEEVRINEGLRVSNNRLHDDLFDLRAQMNSRPTLDPKQLQDIAALVLHSDGQLITRKIQWIKETRALTSCGLKEAKDAVEAVYSEHHIKALRDKLTGDNEPPF